MIYFNLLYHAVPLTNFRLMRHPRTCAPTNGVQQPEHSAPLSLPRKNAQAVSPSYAQSKAQINSPQRISWLLVAVSNVARGCFECCTYRVTALGWLKKERR